MCSVTVAVLLWIPALIGLGTVLPMPNDPGLRRGLAGVLGIGVAGIATMALNLVAPAGPLVSTCLWVTGVGLLLRNRRSVLVGTSWAEVLGGLFALLIALFWYQSPQALSLHSAWIFVLIVLIVVRPEPLLCGIEGAISMR